MSVALVVFGKKSGRKDFALETGPVLIGRKTDADLRIPVAEVSRAHCEIIVEGDDVKLRDLGSSNGTFVNQQKVSRATLKPGDQITIGPVVFTLQVNGVPSVISPMPQAPPAKKPVPAPAPADGSGEIDIDELEELDIDDISDLDLDELDDEELEEIDEADLVPDDDSGSGVIA